MSQEQEMMVARVYVMTDRNFETNETHSEEDVAFAEYAKKTCGVSLKALWGREEIGYLLGRFIEGGQGDNSLPFGVAGYGEIYLIWVDEKARRGKLAAFMISLFKNKIAELGGYWVSLLLDKTKPNLGVNRKIFEKLGFWEAPRVQCPHGDTYEVQKGNAIEMCSLTGKDLKNDEALVNNIRNALTIIKDTAEQGMVHSITAHLIPVVLGKMPDEPKMNTIYLTFSEDRTPMYSYKTSVAEPAHFAVNEFRRRSDDLKSFDRVVQDNGSAQTEDANLWIKKIVECCHLYQ